MLSFRTSKAVKTSLHTDEEHKLEFRFTYERKDPGMLIKVVPYKIEIIEDEEQLSIVPGAETHRTMTIEQLDNLIDVIDVIDKGDPIIYMDALVAGGIQMVMVKEGLWKNQLTLKDFA